MIEGIPKDLKRFRAAAECQTSGAAAYWRRPLAVVRAWRRESLGADVLAGLTVAAVAVPQAIAYAAIAELPPHYGLYTAGIAAIVGALWGCSRHLSTGPTNASSLLVLPVLLSVAQPGEPQYLLAASLVAVLAGVFRVALALLRFGVLVTLASRPVLTGFMAGAAVHIAVGQLRHLGGLDVPAVPELYRALESIVKAAPDTHVVSLALGLGTLLLLLGLRRLGRRVPAALLAVGLAALAVSFLDLEGLGVRIVGKVPSGLPPPTWLGTGLWPDLQLVEKVLLGAMAVAALGLIEAVATAQALARRSGDRLDSNQEFFGQGLANIAAGLFSGYPCSGSLTRSSLAQQAGGRTHLTGIVTGVVVLLALLLLAPAAGFIPRAAIAGVLLLVAWQMVDREGIRRIVRTSRGDAAVLAVTIAATLVLPLDFAVLAGVVFSLAYFVVRSSLPRVVQVVPDETYRHLVHEPARPVCPQMGIMNIRGPLFFGAVYHVEEELRHNHERNPGQNVLVLRLHGVDIIDASGVEMLEATVRTYRERGGDVFLVRPRAPVLAVLEQSGFLDETLGRDHVLAQEGAIEHLFDHVLDPAVCIYECEHRVFAECQALEKHQYDEALPPMARFPHEHGRHLGPPAFHERASDPEALLLDVREPEEFAGGHLPGATLLPLRELPAAGDRLPRDREILLSCRSGRRTTRALYMLEEMGFSRLHGLSGGILAWRAAGLPVTSPQAGPAVTTDSGAGRLVLADMRARTNASRLAQRLEELSAESDPDRLRAAVSQLLEQQPGAGEERPAVTRLDPRLPVLMVSDSHALREALWRLLSDRYLGEDTNLDSLVLGRLQLLMLGDLMHSENRNRWQAVEDEYILRFTTRGDSAAPTPAMDREMCASFGLAAMVMTLQGIPGFHYLKGNHDNLLDADDGGNARLAKFVSWPGEGAIAKAWALQRFGPALAGRYAAWENRQPLLAVHEASAGGLKFLASHSEPAGPYTLEQVAARGDETVRGLTWSRNRGVHAPAMLQHAFGRDGIEARYFVSHTGSEEGIVIEPRNRLVILNKPLTLVTALVRPNTREFEIHMVPGS